MLKKGTGLFVVLLAALSLVAVAGLPAQAAKVALSNDDCVKCHEKPAADIEADGLAHQDAGCRECHKAHRPASKNNIPTCAECHDGEPHYKLPNCLGCHKNPHTPRRVTFTTNLTEPCLTCHADKPDYISPGTQLKRFASKHTQKACSFCHSVHRQKPECTKCHKPHAETMIAKDCGKCHKAHQPKNVVYPATIANQECGGCHKKQVQVLAATTSRHLKVACVQCHKEQHKMVPKCAECHKVTHPAGILAKFPNCLTCHSHPHDLNNFVVKAAAPVQAAPAKK